MKSRRLFEYYDVFIGLVLLFVVNPAYAQQEHNRCRAEGD